MRDRVSRRKFEFLAVVLVLGILALPRADAAPAAAQEIADVTVLIYSHGDNDLDGTLVGPGDLREMVKQASNVNFVVYHDRANGNENGDSAHLDLPLGYSTGFVFRVGADGKTRDLIDLGEPYTMSPQTLGWFVYHGLVNYPAQTTLLVLDDHGGGPNGYFGSEELDTPKGDTNELAGPISLTDVTASIRAGIGAAVRDGWNGGLNGKRLDAIVHSTCLNGNYEIYRELNSISRFVWGSEEVTFGTSINGALDIDYAVPPPPPTDPDRALNYVKSLVQDGPRLNRSMKNVGIANAIFDLDQIQTITSALKQFVNEVKATNGYRYLVESRAVAIGFGQGNGRPRPGLDLYDLGDLLARIPPSAPRRLIAARNALYASIDDARRYLAVDGPYEGARGLSIYFPERREGVSLSYQNLPDASGWTRLIRDSKLAVAPLGELSLTATTTPTAWKATLKSQNPVPRSATGSFILGSDKGTSGIQILSIVEATVGAGATNQVQAVGTLFEFFLGDSLVSAEFNRDLSTVSFEAILVRANTGEQSNVRVSQSAKFQGSAWTFGRPTYVQRVNDAYATISPTSTDLIAPLLSYSSIASGPDTPPYLGRRQIPQKGWPSTTTLVASPLSRGSKYSLVANMWADNYETEGDLAIEQIVIAKQ